MPRLLTGPRFNMRRLRLVGTQQNTVLAILTVVVGVLVLGPVIVLIRASFTPAGEMPLESWAMTLANFATLLVSSSTARLVFNTIVYALSSMVLGVVVATFVAWCTERTDMPGAFLIRVFMYSWMAVPAVVVGFGWILLLNPGNGALNVLFRDLFDIRGHVFTVYSFWTLVVVTAFAVVPTAYVMISGLLRNMDPQLEQASKVLGGGPLVTMFRITLPLLLPGLLSVGIYMFMAVVQTFDLPVIIGLTAGVPVLSTRVYLLSSPVNGMPNYSLAAAFGVVLLVLAIGLMWVYLRFTRTGNASGL
jgi:iron(III) transport system permease protein